RHRLSRDLDRRLRLSQATGRRDRRARGPRACRPSRPRHLLLLRQADRRPLPPPFVLSARVAGGEEGAPRVSVGEVRGVIGLTTRTSRLRRAPPHLPVAAQRVPSSPPLRAYEGAHAAERTKAAMVTARSASPSW